MGNNFGLIFGSMDVLPEGSQVIRNFFLEKTHPQDRYFEACTALVYLILSLAWWVS